MNWFFRARLGRFPVLCILIVLPLLWTFFSPDENSWLHSFCVIIPTLLKGCLLSCWVVYKHLSIPKGLILVFGVILPQAYIVNEALNCPVFVIGFFFVLICLLLSFSIFMACMDIQNKEISSLPVIGIFSRSPEDEYNWLSNKLRSAGEVVPFYITNNNFQEFMDQVSKCTFAILYHSKTRGRVNITDVTDSLYDEEVKHMSKALGREKVLVVVDDVDDSSNWAMNNIFQNQRTIYEKTRDLYLFSRMEKQDYAWTSRRLQPILNTLSQVSSSHLKTDVIEALILCAPWLHYYFGVFNGAALILSNIGGSLLLYNFLLPFRPGLLEEKLKALLLVMVFELLAASWYYTTAVLLVVQSVSIMLYAVLLSTSITFSPRELPAFSLRCQTAELFQVSVQQ